MFLFGARRFGPLGLAYTGYRMWRRLSPQQKAALRGHASRAAGQLRARRSGPPRAR